MNCTKQVRGAVILQKWMLGLGVKQIIDETIKFHQNTLEIFIEGKSCSLFR